MGVALVLVTTLLAAPVSADDASEAALNFELGRELYQQRRYPEALQRFLASNRLVSNPNVIFNIAQTYGLMRRWVEAYNWYETYLHEDLDDADRQEGMSARDRLAPRVAVLDVSSSPAGAALYIDRVELGSVGVAPRRVAVTPGVHEIIARAERFAESQVSAEAGRGHVFAVSLNLQALTGALSVTTDPAGARISTSDGLVLGTSPLESMVPVGRLSLVAEAEGRISQTREVTVEHEQRIEVHLTLPVAASEVALLTVSGGADGANVQVDGVHAGTVPLTLSALSPGSRHLRVEMPMHLTWEGDVALEAGAATRVDVTLVAPTPDSSGLRYGAYGTGVGLLLGGAAAGVAALLGRRSFLESDNPTRAQFDSVRRRGLVADVLLGAGSLIIGVTLVVDLTRGEPARSGATISIER